MVSIQIPTVLKEKNKEKFGKTDKMNERKKDKERKNPWKCLLDEYTPLWKDIKQNQNKPMETT